MTYITRVIILVSTLAVACVVTGCQTKCDEMLTAEPEYPEIERWWK